MSFAQHLKTKPNSQLFECALMKAMGGAMGEAAYWHGPVTYSGGLAVQPGCINFSR
jgi:hypothetical protein